MEKIFEEKEFHGLSTFFKDVTIKADVSITGILTITGGLIITGNLDVSGDIDGVKRYEVLLTQTGTSAPVATVLKNTLGGTVVWAYSAVGTYTFTLAGAFTVNKSTIMMGRENTSLPDSAGFQTDFADVNSGFLLTTDGASTSANGRLTATTFEIKVYE